jgi:hypothetical protein
MTSWNDLHWRKPERIIEFDRAAPPPQEADRFPWNLEVPFIPGTTPIQEAKDLLQLASQVEHGLMVEYLYAAYTAAADASWDTRKRDALSGLTTGIRLIAQEEMGHLITVENLIVLCGVGQANLNRQDQAPNPKYDPFPFQLAPLSLQTIARFAVCESPQGIPPSEIQELKDLAGRDLPEGVKQVGGLYMKIYWLFLPSDQPSAGQNPWKAFDPGAFLRKKENADEAGRHLSDANLVPSNTLSETQSADWRRSNQDLKILSAANRIDALNALTQVIEQGEGPTTAARSHFDRFKSFYQEAKSKQLVPTLVSQAKYVPNPTTDANRKQGNLIKNKIPAALSDLLDSFYRAIISQTLLSMQSKYKSKREDLTKCAQVDMRIVTDISNRIVSYDLVDDAHPTTKAGPAFMPDKLAQPPQDPLAAFKVANAQSRSALVPLEAMSQTLPFGLRSSLSGWKQQVAARDSLAGVLSQIA